MPTKTPSIISTILTVILLIIFSIGSGFFLLVALNGFSESDGGPGLIAALVCNVVGIILAAILAWRLPRWLVERFSWNRIVAVLVSVAAGLFLGGGLSFVSMFIGVLLASAIQNAR